MKPNPKIQELIKSLGITPEDEHYEVADLVIAKCIESIQGCSMGSSDEWESGLRMAEGSIKERFEIK